VVVLSPADVAEAERFLPLLHGDETERWLSIGPSVAELFPAGSRSSAWDRVRGCLQGEGAGEERYLINCDGEEEEEGEEVGNDDDIVSIRLTFLQDARGTDLLRGCLHAHILRAMLLSSSPRGRRKEEEEGERPPGFGFSMIERSHAEMLSLADSFVARLEENGWDVSTETVQVESGNAKRLKIEEG